MNSCQMAPEGQLGPRALVNSKATMMSDHPGFSAYHMDPAPRALSYGLPQGPVPGSEPERQEGGADTAQKEGGKRLLCHHQNAFPKIQKPAVPDLFKQASL